MSDEKESAISPEKSPVVAKAGNIIKTSFPQQNNLQEVAGDTKSVSPDNQNNNPADSSDAKTEEKLPDNINEEHIKTWFEKNGIKWDGDVSKLKEKVAYEIPAPTPTDEEVKAKEAAKEKRILDKWVADGGKVEDFVALKNVAKADVAELSKSEIRRELKAESFTDEEIDEIIRTRYFQTDPEQIEQGEDETEEEFTKRKEGLKKLNIFGAKKLANRSSHLKTKAEQIIGDLYKEIEEEDQEKEIEKQFSATVETHFKTFPKEQKIEVGELDKGLTPEPITHTISDDSIQKAEQLLKNSAELKKFLYNKDGSLNLTNLSPLLVGHFNQQELLKDVYRDATTRNTETWQKRFPMNTAQALGVGGAPIKLNGEKGRVAKAGTTERASFPQN